MSEVFISYVHEDARFVEFLAFVLRRNGVKVWLDKENLAPGMRWKAAIREAIKRGTFFISVHSKQRETRDVSYSNEELTLAIEEIRKRPANKTWFIPVIIDDCEIVDRDIGGGETLSDLQRCDMRSWRKGMSRLLDVLGVSEPVLDDGEPLAPGIGSAVEISNGFIRYDLLPGLPPMMQGLEFRVSSGWCNRHEDGGILAYIETVAPMKPIQDVNSMAGLSGFHAYSDASQISDTTDNLTRFSYERDYVLPAGLSTPDIATGNFVTLPFDLRVFTFFEAFGHISNNIFSGTFEARIESGHPSVALSQIQHGYFELSFAAPS